jgi:hypothetical protein
MQLEDLVGKLVLFRFTDEIRQDFPLFQVYDVNLWAVVTGVENEGIWIQNPSYELGIWWDNDGNLIPSDKQKKENIETDILILWRYIKGLMSVRDARFRRVEMKEPPGFRPNKQG